MKKEFQIHVRSIQQGVSGLLRKQIHSDTSQETTCSDEVASNAAGSRTAGVQRLLYSYLLPTQSGLALKCEWIPDMRAALKLVESLPKSATIAADPFDIFLRTPQAFAIHLQACVSDKNFRKQGIRKRDGQRVDERCWREEECHSASTPTCDTE